MKFKKTLSVLMAILLVLAFVPTVALAATATATASSATEVVVTLSEATETALAKTAFAIAEKGADPAVNIAVEEASTPESGDGSNSVYTLTTAQMTSGKTYTVTVTIAEGTTVTADFTYTAPITATAEASSATEVVVTLSAATDSALVAGKFAIAQKDTPATTIAVSNATTPESGQQGSNSVYTLTTDTLTSGTTYTVTVTLADNSTITADFTYTAAAAEDITVESAQASDANTVEVTLSAATEETLTFTLSPSVTVSNQTANGAVYTLTTGDLTSGTKYTVTVSGTGISETSNTAEFTYTAAEPPAPAGPTLSDFDITPAQTNILGKNSGDFVDGELTFTPDTTTPTTIAVTGTLTYVEGFTAFSTDEQYQSGWYLPFVFTAAPDGATVMLKCATSPEGVAVPKGDDCLVNFPATMTEADLASLEVPIELVVTSGDKTATYTLDVSGLTLTPNPATDTTISNVIVPTVEILGKPVTAFYSVAPAYTVGGTEAEPTITATGTLTYIADFTAFSNEVQYQSGWYLPFQFTAPEGATVQLICATSPDGVTVPANDQCLVNFPATMTEEDLANLETPIQLKVTSQDSSKTATYTFDVSGLTLTPAPAPITVKSAVAISATSVEVTLSAAPTLAPLTAESFAITGPEGSAAVVVSTATPGTGKNDNVYTLTTSALSPGVQYTVTVTGTGIATTGNTATFNALKETIAISSAVIENSAATVITITLDKSATLEAADFIITKNGTALTAEQVTVAGSGTDYTATLKTAAISTDEFTVAIDETATTNAVAAFDVTNNVAAANVGEATTLLQKAIAAAQKLADSTQVSTEADAVNIPASEKWVTQEVMTALEEAIETATTALNSAEATLESLTAAKTALNSAVTTFNAALQPGTQPATPTIEDVTLPTIVLFGKSASDLVDGELTTSVDGDIITVAGTLKYVANFEDFSSIPKDQSGWYLPLTVITSEGANIELKLICASSGEDGVVLDSDKTCVINFPAGSTIGDAQPIQFTVQDGTSEIATYTLDISGLVLQNTLDESLTPDSKIEITEDPEIGAIAIGIETPAKGGSTPSVADFLAANFSAIPGATVGMIGADGKPVDTTKPVGTGMVVRTLDADGNVINEATVIIKGDLSGSGKTDTGDITLMAQFIVGQKTPSPIQALAGDVAGTSGGGINIGDLTVLVIRFVG